MRLPLSGPNWAGSVPIVARRTLEEVIKSIAFPIWVGFSNLQIVGGMAVKPDVRASDKPCVKHTGQGASVYASGEVFLLIESVHVGGAEQDRAYLLKGISPRGRTPTLPILPGGLRFGRGSGTAANRAALGPGLAGEVNGGHGFMANGAGHSVYVCGFNQRLAH